MNLDATKDLLDLALQAAALGRPIYQVDFSSDKPPMTLLRGGAQPVLAIQQLLRVTDKSQATMSLAADYLLCCCTVADREHLKKSMEEIFPGISAQRLFLIESPVAFKVISWTEEIQYESGEIYDRVVQACVGTGDRPALDYWLDVKKIDPMLAIPYFSKKVGGLQFLAEKIELDFIELGKKNYASELRMGDEHRDINNFFNAAAAKKAITAMLAKHKQNIGSK